MPQIKSPVPNRGHRHDFSMGFQMSSSQKDRKPFLPPIEALETRSTPAAGITASLVRGQLVTNGTLKDDNITLVMRGLTVVVQGVPGAIYPARMISSILINAGSGNDSVRANGEFVYPNTELVH